MHPMFLPGSSAAVRSSSAMHITQDDRSRAGPTRTSRGCALRAGGSLLPPSAATDARPGHARRSAGLPRCRRRGHASPDAHAGPPAAMSALASSPPDHPAAQVASGAVLRRTSCAPPPRPCNVPARGAATGGPTSRAAHGRSGCASESRSGNAEAWWRIALWATLSATYLWHFSVVVCRAVHLCESRAVAPPSGLRVGSGIHLELSTSHTSLVDSSLKNCCSCRIPLFLCSR